jgi:hypothetical protein
MEIGTASGLAQDFGFDKRINDLRYRQEALKRQQDQNSAKDALFANDMDFQKSSNAYDNPKVADMNRQIVQELGDYVSNNPDWETSVQKRGYIKLLKNKLKDNPEVMRALHSDSNYKQLLGDLQEVAKNPQQHDSEAYQQYLGKWNNYQQYGNQDGPEALKMQGVKPFTYVKPQDFINLPDTLQKAGGSIKDYNVIKPKGGNIGEYYTEPKADQVKALKDAIFQQHGRQIMVEARKLGFTTPEQVDKWVSDGIASGFNKHYSLGDANAQFDNYIKSENLRLHKAKAAQEMASNASYTPFDYLTDKNTTAGQMNPDDIKKVWGDKPINPVSGNSGARADLSDFPVEYSGKYVRKQGMPFMLGKINIPLEIAEQRGLYKEPFGPNLGRTGTITPDFLDKAQIVEGTDKEGNPMKFVAVNYELPINVRDKVARDKFNAFVLPDKLVENSSNPYSGQESNVPSASVQEWMSAGWTQDQIKQGLQEGKIHVK